MSASLHTGGMTEGTISGFPQDLAGLVSNRVASRCIDSTSTNSILSAPCATYHHCDARALAGEGTSRASPQARISSFITFSQDQLVPLQTQYAANSVPYSGMSGALGGGQRRCVSGPRGAGRDGARPRSSDLPQTESGREIACDAFPRPARRDPHAAKAASDFIIGAGPPSLYFSANTCPLAASATVSILIVAIECLPFSHKRLPAVKVPDHNAVFAVTCRARSLLRR